MVGSPCQAVVKNPYKSPFPLCLCPPFLPSPSFQLCSWTEASGDWWGGCFLHVAWWKILVLGWEAARGAGVSFVGTPRPWSWTTSYLLATSRLNNAGWTPWETIAEPEPQASPSTSSEHLRVGKPSTAMAGSEIQLAKKSWRSGLQKSQGNWSTETKCERHVLGWWLGV